MDEGYLEYYERYTRDSKADDTFRSIAGNTLHVFNVTEDDREKVDIPEFVIGVVVYEFDGGETQPISFIDELEMHSYLEAVGDDYNDEYLPED